MQVASGSSPKAWSRSTSFGRGSWDDPPVSRLALDPVSEPVEMTASMPPDRSSRVDLTHLEEQPHPALSRRAISDSPDALNASLPRTSHSRLGHH